MKTLFLIVLVLAIQLLTAITASAAETDMPETVAEDPAAEQSDTVIDTGEADESEDVKFTKPTLKQIAQIISARQAGLQKDDYLYVMNRLKIENQKEVDVLFDKFRTYDLNVMKRGKSSTAKAAEKKYASASRQNTQGKLRKKTGKRFVMYYPEKMTVYEKGKPVTKSTEDALEIETLISEAEMVFGQTTEEVMMSSMINWAGKVRASVYIIVNDSDWQSLKSGRTKSRPVQTVITEDDYREFFVYAGPKVYDYAQSALKYAVAELVLKEYSMVTGGERKTELPEFYLAGLATKISALDSVITEDGPRQLKKWKNNDVSASMLRKLRSGTSESGLTQMPLYMRKLISFENLVGPNAYPGDDEKMYYFIRQSSALVDYLLQNGSLAFLTMSEALSDGERLEKAFDDSYVEVRDKLSGKTGTGGRKTDSKKDERLSREERRKQRRDEKDRKEKQEMTEDVLNGYKELRRNAEEVIFAPLTAEYLQDSMPDKKTRDRKKTPKTPGVPIGR